MNKTLRVLFLVGCSLVGAVLACGSPTQVLTLNMNEERTDQVLKEASDSLHGEGWSFSYQRVDLQEDWMRVHGAFVEGDIPPINGYLDMRLYVDKVALESELLGGNFGDFHPTDPVLVSLAESIELAIEQAVEGDLQAVQYVLVEMLDDLVKIQIRFLPGNPG